MGGSCHRGCARHVWAPDGFVLLLVLRVRGSPLRQTNSKCFRVNGKISGVIASQGLNRKSNPHTINGHNSQHSAFPLHDSAAHRSCANPDSDWQSPQNIPEPKDRLGSMNLFFYISFSRRWQRREGVWQGVVSPECRSWPRHCGVAAELWPCPSACRALHCSSSRDRRAGTA